MMIDRESVHHKTEKEKSQLEEIPANGSHYTTVNPMF